MGEYITKIVMLGDPAVGKTSLVRRFVDDMFDDKYISTVGAKPSKKVVEIENDEITLMVWDIAGHSLVPLHPGYYAGAKGALIVCDLTRRQTLNAVTWWHSLLHKWAGDIPTKILANKSDLDDREFELEDIKHEKMNPQLTSAKSGENVDEAFHELAEMIIYGR